MAKQKSKKGFFGGLKEGFKEALSDEIAKGVTLNRFYADVRDIVNDELDTHIPKLTEDALESPVGTFVRISKRQELKLVEITKTTRSIKEDTTYIRRKIDKLEKKNEPGFLSSLISSVVGGMGFLTAITGAKLINKILPRMLLGIVGKLIPAILVGTVIGGGEDAREIRERRSYIRAGTDADAQLNLIKELQQEIKDYKQSLKYYKSIGGHPIKENLANNAITRLQKELYKTYESLTPKDVSLESRDERINPIAQSFKDPWSQIAMGENATPKQQSNLELIQLAEQQGNILSSPQYQDYPGTARGPWRDQTKTYSSTSTPKLPTHKVAIIYDPEHDNFGALVEILRTIIEANIDSLYTVKILVGKNVNSEIRISSSQLSNIVEYSPREYDSFIMKYKQEYNSRYNNSIVKPTSYSQPEPEYKQYLINASLNSSQDSFDSSITPFIQRGRLPDNMREGMGIPSYSSNEQRRGRGGGFTGGRSGSGSGGTAGRENDNVGTDSPERTFQYVPDRGSRTTGLIDFKPGARQVEMGIHGGKQTPVDYQSSKFASELGISQSEYYAMREGIAQIENANYGQMGGSSSRFAGRYQMGSAEIRETAESLGVPIPSRAQFLADPQMQERFFEEYTLNHHKYLMNNPKYANASPQERLKILGYAHNQGAAGASQWLTSGVAGSDAFGTKGTKYYDTIGSRLSATPQDPYAARMSADIASGKISSPENSSYASVNSNAQSVDTYDSGNSIPPEGEYERRFNVMQNQGVNPYSVQNDIVDINTPFGSAKAHKTSATAFEGFFGDLHEAGAPIKNIGSLAIRKKQSAGAGHNPGGGWSSHSYGYAMDLDNATQLSPEMKQWMIDNPGKMDELRRKWGMSTPKGDDPHMEFGGYISPDAASQITASRQIRNEQQSQLNNLANMNNEELGRRTGQLNASHLKQTATPVSPDNSRDELIKLGNDIKDLRGVVTKLESKPEPVQPPNQPTATVSEKVPAYKKKPLTAAQAAANEIRLDPNKDTRSYTNYI